MNKYATDREALEDKSETWSDSKIRWRIVAKYRAMRAYIYDTANNLGLGRLDKG